MFERASPFFGLGYSQLSWRPHWGFFCLILVPYVINVAANLRFAVYNERVSRWIFVIVEGIRNGT